MKITKGLFTDCLEVDQPAGTYRFAKNTVNSNILGSLENEKGFLDLGYIAGTTKKPIGVVPTGESFVVFSYDTISTESEIGLWEDGSYTVVYNDSSLNFSLTTPIVGEYRRNLSGERIVAFIDDVNEPRIINIDAPNINSIEDINIFPAITNPKISTYSVSDFGGSLKSAAYIPITRYRSEDGSTYTNWYVHDKVFYINDEASTISFQLNDGCEPGTVTSKSISITFSECDTAFERLEYGYIKVEGQVTTAVSVSTKILSSTVSLVITGSESSTDLALDEVLVSTANYKTAKAITQINGELVLANLTTEPLPDLQAIACSIRIDYTYDASPILLKNNSTTHKSSLPNTFIPGEVYAFYLGVELDDGRKALYHIPGRAAVSDETSTISTDGISHKKYQIEDTCNYGGAATNMGFWENVNETYPDDSARYGSLVGQPVRHHRMPSLRYLTASVFSATTTWGVDRLSRLGISVSNVNIPLADQARIKRWKIYFAKKTVTNSLVLGDDLLQIGVVASNSTSIKRSSGGNWNISAEDSGGFISGWGTVTSAVDKTVIRGHSLDLSLNNIIPDYISLNYKLAVPVGTYTGTAGINKPYFGFGTTGMIANTGAALGDNVAFVIDYTAIATTTRSISSGIRKLTGAVNVGQNSLSGNFSNISSDGCLWANITAVTLNTNTLYTNSFSVSSDASPLGLGGGTGEETYQISYCKILTDVHTDFFSQEVVPVEGGSAPNVSTLSTNGGDGFMIWTSFMTAAPRQYYESDGTAPGVRVWRAHVGYSRNNWNFRHQEQGNLGTYYYGKTDPATLFNPAPDPGNITGGVSGVATCIYDLAVDQLNSFKYNIDYSTQNDLQPVVIWYPDLVDETSQPNLVIYSTVQGEETEILSWRTFPAGNRYVMPKHKGEIINVQAIDNRNLLIHHKYTLFRTRADVGMAADGESVYLKSNELFAIPPEEIVSSSVGYGGTQSKLSCVMTKVGYAFVDDLQGKVFIYNGQALEEISSNGTRIFFRDNMSITSSSKGVFPADQYPDNPFVYMGYTLVYDEYYNRLIVTKRHYDGTLTDLSWTASYNPITQSWVSFHDYQANYMFSLVNGKNYLIKDNKLYQMNAGPPGIYFGNVIPFPWFVDVVQNPDPDQDKIFVAANWMTESYSPLGVPDYTDTFTHLTVRSWDHATGKLDMSSFSGVDSLYNETLRNINRVWYFNGLRDIVTQSGFVTDFYNDYNLDPSKLDTNTTWYDKRKFLDKYVILRLEYDNLSGNRLMLQDSRITYRNAAK